MTRSLFDAAGMVTPSAPRRGGRSYERIRDIPEAERVVAFGLGYEAYRNGVPLTSNGYADSTSAAWLLWRDGWGSAHNDSQ